MNNKIDEWAPLKAFSEFGDKIETQRNKSIWGIPLIGEVEEKEAVVNKNNCQYSISGNTFWPCGETKICLPAGIYSIMSSQQGIYFKKENLFIDDLITFEDGQPKEILDEIERFWARKAEFKKYGYLHKRGILLYGKQGGGKSCLVHQVINGIQNKDGIVILCTNPTVVNNGLKIIREIEPDRGIVIAYEDIDSIIQNYGESAILSLLDGEDQIDNVLNLATTNYPERLEKRIVNRPRRFDKVIRIGMPDKRMREAYFLKKLKLELEDVDKYVKNSDGFTFAAMAELVISVKCLGNDFDKTVKHLKTIAEFNPTSEEDEGQRKVGFGV